MPAFQAGWLVLALAAVAIAQQCETPDVANARCVCAGTTYDFSQMKNPDGSQYDHVIEHSATC
eukprot:m.138850 g.138850  ORF g.138850 m.138850 type:complete len:63 (-) comp9605_c0_seq2:57-245(-)